MRDDPDLYCLHCGYNLRGLHGKTVRCPECFFENPLAGIVIPASTIKQALKSLESSPATTVALMYVLLPLLISILLLLRATVANLMVFLSISVATMLLFVFALSWNVRKFKISCRQAPSWTRSLLKYHAYALLLLGTVVGWFGLTMYIMLVYQSSNPISGSVVVIISGVAAVLAIEWGYRRAKKDMEHLQRNTAVRISQEIIRKQLAREYRINEAAERAAANE